MFFRVRTTESENEFEMFCGKWNVISVIFSFHMLKWLKKNALQLLAKKEYWLGQTLKENSAQKNI